MNLIHEFGAWWFFAEFHQPPAAIFGSICLGSWLPSIGRWLRRHLTPTARRERAAAKRYWTAVSR